MYRRAITRVYNKIYYSFEFDTIHSRAKPRDTTANIIFGRKSY